MDPEMLLFIAGLESTEVLIHPETGDKQTAEQWACDAVLWTREDGKEHTIPKQYLLFPEC